MVPLSSSRARLLELSLEDYLEYIIDDSNRYSSRKTLKPFRAGMKRVLAPEKR